MGQDSRLNNNVREADEQTTGTMFWRFAERFKNDDKRFHEKNPAQRVPYEGKYPTRDKPKSEQLNMCITKLTFWWHNYWNLHKAGQRRTLQTENNVYY